jgi:hypothetical protein
MDNYYRRSLEGTVDLIRKQLKQLKGQGQEVKVTLSTAVRRPWTPLELV